MSRFRLRVCLSVAAVALAIFASADHAADSPAASTSPAPSVKRTVLRRVDVPNSPYEVVFVLVEVPANTSVGRHTHPGSVIGYVIEGTYTMMIDGRPSATLQPGESLEVPSGAIHDERSGRSPAKLIAVFTVEKGKPLATPAK